MDRVLIGADRNAPLYEFNDVTMKPSPVCVLSSSLTMDQLSVDEFSPVVYHEAYIRVKFAPSGSSGLVTSDGDSFLVYVAGTFLDKLPYGTPIWYFSNDVLMGKFYSKRVIRTGKAWFDIQAVSAIGILDGQTHNGGLYSGHRFDAVAADIIGGSLSFSCDADVAALPVFGWLPKTTRRANLHQLLFAHGVAIKKDADGNMVFKFPDTETVKNIPDSRIFVGGNIDYQTPATRVDISEHAFLKLPSDETVTLFDNTDGSGVADYTTVDFQNAPIHDLEWTGGLTVHESGVNYAVLSGTGVLTGKRYTHTTRIVSLESGSDGENKTVSVTDATLVSLVNSDYVARRVLSYYSSARTIAADIVLEDEKPGDQISFNNPFDEPEIAFLASMEVTSSSFLRSACEIVTNYKPEWFGNNYSQVVLLTGSGTWTHSGRVRAVLVGGGEGGWSGCDGKNGEGGVVSQSSGGDGGESGKPGRGGRILSVNLDVNGSISYSCGVGGLGGLNNGEISAQGEDGTDTVFGTYSTADGERSQTGAANLFTGDVYGITGLYGVRGAPGASSSNPIQTVTYDGVTYTQGARGTDKGTASGGYGGGPAAGSNGASGKNAYADNVNDKDGYSGGNGGQGATAVAPPDATGYGTGGDGGNGGGGGGEGGGSGYGYGFYGSPGNGGKGSAGGRGADGCVIIYFE
ncbi:MAG: hypothetical protein IKU94_00685 [Bacteroidaceae bacterium]|nr:hypothetical protein [Bacteroidaceae bacterium]MBR4930447.1 hypothetical protein [Bacteroidaceae bacterium]